MSHKTTGMYKFPLVLSIVVTLGLAMASITAAQEAPSGQDPDEEQEAVTRTVLEDVGSAQFRGIALLRGLGEETQVLIVMPPQDGSIPGVPAAEGEIGDIVVLRGTCDFPAEIVHVLGRPGRVELEQPEGAYIHSLLGTIPFPFETLISRGYALAVLLQTDQEPPALEGTPDPEGPAPATPAPATPDSILPASQNRILACGMVVLPVPSPDPSGPVPPAPPQLPTE